MHGDAKENKMNFFIQKIPILFQKVSSMWHQHLLFLDGHGSHVAI
jgi:hypothetical protein